MTGSSRLQTTIMQLNGDLESKQKLAESLLTSAKTHADSGDDVKAKLEQESAEKYQKEAEEIQGKIANMQALITVNHLRVKSIEKDIDNLTSNYKKELDKLESERDSLV